MVIAVVPALAALAGALVYALATSQKLTEIGRLTYVAALLALMLALASVTVRLG